jgi:hypothetical protein
VRLESSAKMAGVSGGDSRRSGLAQRSAPSNLETGNRLHPTAIGLPGGPAAVQSVAAITHLQRMAGNAAVTRLLGEGAIAASPSSRGVLDPPAWTRFRADGPWLTGTVQRGVFDLLGPANPRPHLPPALGGYSGAQMQRRTTRAALRGVAGLPPAAIPILMGLHPSVHPPVPYTDPQITALAQALVALGGGIALRAQQVCNVIAAANVVLPGSKVVPLLVLAPPRSVADVATLTVALVNNPLWQPPRVRDLALLPQALSIANVTLLTPLARTVADIGTLLGGLPGGVPAPTPAQIVQLAATQNADILVWASIAQVAAVAAIIQLSQIVGGRPPADLRDLALHAPGLSFVELLPLASTGVGGPLGEYFVQDGIHQNRRHRDWVTQIQNAAVPARRTVANHQGLRGLVRERWVAASDATPIMAMLLQGSLRWPEPSGPNPTEGYQIDRTSTFANWIRGGNENANRPRANAVSSMNCWEGVFFSAYLAGKVSYAQLTTIHAQAAGAGHGIDPGGVGTVPAQDAYYDQLAHFLNAHNATQWRPRTHPRPVLPRGDIVFFTTAAAPTDPDKLEHVAVSLGGRGNAAEIMSLWTLPGNTFLRVTIGQLLTSFPSKVWRAPNPW